MLSVTFLTLALALVTANPAPPAATPSASRAPSAEKTIVGEIVSIDPGQGKVVVQETSRTVRAKGEAPRREVVELLVDGSTSVLIGRNPSSLAELKARDHVVVRYVVAPRGPRATSLKVAERTPSPPPSPPAITPTSAAPPAG